MSTVANVTVSVVTLITTVLIFASTPSTNTEKSVFNGDPANGSSNVNVRTLFPVFEAETKRVPTLDTAFIAPFIAPTVFDMLLNWKERTSPVLPPNVPVTASET